MKVLVVDDSKLARMAIGKALNAIDPNCTRIEATNADEALDKVKSDNPDVAVFDFNMPGRDGLTLAAEVLALRPKMPLAIISANHQKEVVDRALAVGAAFLAKPVTEPALKEFMTNAAVTLKATNR